MGRLRRKVWAFPLLILCFLWISFLWNPFSVDAATILKEGYCGAWESGYDGRNVRWTLDSDGTLTLSGNGMIASYSAMRVNGTEIRRGDISTSDLIDLVETVDENLLYCTDMPWAGEEEHIRSIVIEEGITHIGANAFFNLHHAESVKLPDSLIEVGVCAFMNCRRLQNISLPQNLEYILAGAFAHCQSITVMRLRLKIRTLAEKAFYHCSSLEKLYVSGALIECFDSYCLGKCTALREVRFGNGIPRLTPTAFVGVNATFYYMRRYNTYVPNVNFQNANISWQVFEVGPEDGAWLETAWMWEGDYLGNQVHWAISVDYYASIIGYKLSLTGSGPVPDSGPTPGYEGEHPWDSYRGETFFTDISIGEGITALGDRSLAGLEKITSFEIPKSVTSLGSQVFAASTDHPVTRKIRFTGKLPSFSPDTFDNTVALVFYPANEISWLLADLPDNPTNGDITWIGYDPNHDNENQEMIQYANHGKCGDNVLWQINDGTLYITGEGAMYDYKDRVDPFYKLRDYFTKIYVEKDITHIGSYAFNGCSNVQSIYIEDTVESIGEAAFRRCTSLREVHLPEDLERMEDYLFEGCTALTSINLPDNVAVIGAHAMESCTGLTLIDLPAHLVEIRQYAFSDSIRLNLTGIPSSLQTIGAHAFDGCLALTSLELAELTRIDAFAFANCTSLTDVTLGNDYSGEQSALSIGSYAFAGNLGLTNVDLGRNVNRIGSGAFLHCPKLFEMTVWETVTEIGSYAFGFLNASSKTQSESATADTKAYRLLQGFKIYGTDPSRVCDYAKEKGIPFEVKVRNQQEADEYNLQEDQTLIVYATASTIKAGTTCAIGVTGNRTPLTFRSSKPSVASVNPYGFVTGKKSGTVTITVTAIATKKYRKKTAKIKIKVTSKNVKCLSVTSCSNHSCRIRWKKYDYAKGYVIQYGRNRDFNDEKDYKTIYIKKASRTSVKIKGLQKGKRYYARVAAIDKDGNLLSNWNYVKVPR